MVAMREASQIFADARSLHSSALERFEAGDIRDAAEKAWCATLRSTHALILARTGDVPEKSPATSKALRALARQDQRVRSLINRYYARMGSLHGECFYLGLCDPVDDIEERIRDTANYIQDAEALAGV